MKQRIRQDLELGHNIRTLRTSKGMTQPEVVAKLQTYGIEISRSYYSRIEIGQLNVHVSVLVALQEIFQCSYSDFFTGLREQLEHHAAETNP